MNLLKIITLLNWIFIGIIGLLVAVETIFPAKGGDPAGRGMGLAIYYLAIIVLVVLVTLNLMPYNWSKYTAFVLIAVPFLLWMVGPVFGKVKRHIASLIEYSKPVFEDKARDQVAKAIRDGDPEKVKMLLQSPVPRLNEEGDLLAFAINETSGSAYRPDEKIECIRLLFEAGASYDSLQMHMEVPLHFAVASTGHSALLRLLLQNGANPNAVQQYFKQPVIFEAIGSYMEPEATVRVLLEYGADPNARAVLSDELGPVSPLWNAVEHERWGICLLLLDKGADPDFKLENGKTLRERVVEAEKDMYWGDHSKKEDYEQFRERLK